MFDDEDLPPGDEAGRVVCGVIILAALLPGVALWISGL